MAAPLTPRPRGTIYEALPLIVERDRDEIPGQDWDQEEDMAMPVERRKNVHIEKGSSKTFYYQ